MGLTTERLNTLVQADRSLPGLLEARLRTRSDVTLLECGDERLSYADVDARANAIANGLRAAGVQRGDRVALMMSNCSAWVAFWLGASKLGAITVTINTAHK